MFLKREGVFDNISAIIVFGGRGGVSVSPKKKEEKEKISHPISHPPTPPPKKGIFPTFPPDTGIYLGLYNVSVSESLPIRLFLWQKNSGE